jgi:hypothetical protein
MSLPITAAGPHQGCGPCVNGGLEDLLLGIDLDPNILLGNLTTDFLYNARKSQGRRVAHYKSFGNRRTSAGESNVIVKFFIDHSS